MISFSHDVPSNYDDGFLPVLDVKVKLQDSGNLVYQFYEKPTESCKVILADSALSWRQKRTILTQEALRRLKNTSFELGKEVQDGHLSEFMLKLKDSGYDMKFRSEIVFSAKKAYRILLEKDKNVI